MTGRVSVQGERGGYCTDCVFFSRIRRRPRSTLFPYTTLCRSGDQSYRVSTRRLPEMDVPLRPMGESFATPPELRSVADQMLKNTDAICTQIGRAHV